MGHKIPALDIMQISESAKKRGIKSPIKRKAFAAGWMAAMFSLRASD